jgi:glucosamine--fructose-6-phosphate aminotransferase (isomerizing)
MCGIFGVVLKDNLERNSSKKIVSLANLSSRRGSDASGLIIGSDISLQIYKKNASVRELIKELDFSLNSFKSSKFILGHSRLSTHGEVSDDTNQPIFENGWLILHNGIITNHSDYEKSAHLISSDSAAIGVALSNLDDLNSMESALNELLGEISCILISPDQKIFAYSNVGNLFNVKDENENYWVASERVFLQKLHPHRTVSQIPLKRVVRIDLEKNIKVGIESHSLSDYSEFSIEKQGNEKIVPDSVHALNRLLEVEMAERERCSRCILPSNFPGLKLDSSGVCNICNAWVSNDMARIKSLEDLKQDITIGKRIQVNLSGGRDSCYMLIRLHELGFQPYAFTYDWGLITTAARENMANLCGKLGVEHIIVSPNLRELRALAATSLRSWFKFQDPTAIPALMAGDKPFFRYAKIVSAENNGATIFQGDHVVESTHFKSALSGGSLGKVPESGAVAYRLTILSLLRMSVSYLRLIAHADRSRIKLMKLLVGSAYIYYFEKHPFIHYFGYENWDEKLLNEKLANYGWSINERNDLQKWRMGDATSPLYNFLYLLSIGYTENDAFKSNQIREGQIDRTSALRSCIEENKIDYYGVENYLRIISFLPKDFWEEISKIVRKKYDPIDFSDCLD